MLVPVDQLEESAKRYAALQQAPGRANAGAPVAKTMNRSLAPAAISDITGKTENLAKRVKMLATIKQEPVDFAFERAIGKNDSVYSNFVELIRDAKQKVGRIAIKNGNKNIGFATGFMVSQNLLLTNWHVFQTNADVADSEIQFFYELTISGNPGTAVCFKLKSEQFFHSNKELDYCFVAVNPTDISGKMNLADISYIFLDPSLGKLGNEHEEALNIIHHPDGDYKQLSIRENLFTQLTPTTIWYKTDTAPGSSGSPVFNDQWQVVALHHMGVGKKNSAGEYVDKDGKVIPKINGQIDSAKIVWDANEGIRISVIVKDLLSAFPNEPLVKGLQVKPAVNDSPPPQEIQHPQKDIPATNARNYAAVNTDNYSNNVVVSFPASLVENNGTVNISITRSSQDATLTRIAKTLTATEKDQEFAEIKRLEDSSDFSACKGYQSRFLGTHLSVALPQPQKEIKKFIAKVAGTDSLVLRYYNYSTVFHSVRMMPVISGINIDGDPEKRKDESPRKDVWLRDKRLSFDIQLSDSYYKGSGFDRGHMSRREDAKWGATPEEAKRNADFTCMYTNACPQVAKINQSRRKGLWGILEKIVLESGAEAEKGKTAKISVFNGPIFKDDDPVFRGIQVPMDFYKIVLWLTNKGALKATAFKLTQTELVGDIDFEQLDLDQNTQFKEFQCSIKWLHEKTKLDFSHLFEHDTFEGKPEAEVEITSAHEVLAHLSKHKKA